MKRKKLEWRELNQEHFGKHQVLHSAISHFTKPALVMLVRHTLNPPTGCHSPSSFLLRNVRWGESWAVSWELLGMCIVNLCITTTRHIDMFFRSRHNYKLTWDVTKTFSAILFFPLNFLSFLLFELQVHHKSITCPFGYGWNTTRQLEKQRRHHCSWQRRLHRLNIETSLYGMIIRLQKFPMSNMRLAPSKPLSFRAAADIIQGRYIAEVRAVFAICGAYFLCCSPTGILTQSFHTKIVMRL